MLSTSPNTAKVYVELDPEPQNKVTFFPLLHEQRQGWVLEVLRRENVKSVVDVGCGEGALLACLCNPPGALPDYGPVPSRSRTPPPSKPSQASNRTLLKDQYDDDLHVYKIQGLDINSEETRRATESTRPDDHRPYSLQRWDPLEVKMWEGSFRVWNEAFVDEDCIVATEVIEHLRPHNLSAFAPVLLGAYRPRLLLITTPSYTYNSRFSPPGKVDPSGFPDKTGLTSRVFRHWDHKFEWTREEFREYCEKAAEEWGYHVEIGSIGVAVETDPWGRDEELGKASQTAVFRRKEGGDVMTMGQRKTLAATDGQLLLLATHEYRAHLRAHKPRTLDEIVVCINKAMEDSYFDDVGATLWNLWVTDDIAPLCGGHMDILVQALEICNDLIIHKDTGVARTDWKLAFRERKRERSKEELGQEKEQEQLTWDSNIETSSAYWDDVVEKTWEPAIQASSDEEKIPWDLTGEDGWDAPSTIADMNIIPDAHLQLSWAKETNWS